MSTYVRYGTGALPEVVGMQSRCEPLRRAQVDVEFAASIKPLVKKPILKQVQGDLPITKNQELKTNLKT